MARILETDRLTTTDEAAVASWLPNDSRSNPRVGGAARGRFGIFDLLLTMTGVAISASLTHYQGYPLFVAAILFGGAIGGFIGRVSEGTADGRQVGFLMGSMVGVLSLWTVLLPQFIER